MQALLIGLAVVLAATTCAEAGQRSSAAKAEFKRQQPCPATSSSRGPCPGHVVDHVVPLCAGGADHASNMQWQTAAEAKTKDRAEIAQCRTKSSAP